MNMNVGFKEIWAKITDEIDLEWERKRREKWVLKKNYQFEKKIVLDINRQRNSNPR